ncbi:scarecrow-like protein 30 [Coffea eugenioides]|uniref:Scarecrow-like protein 30 n=1 Tax=Coffea arabica TaxID=13443 RepID=A0ABM4V9Z8_COFAR|nr:scarecrow-like protein 30 [Coffea eugenioides]
MDTLVEPFPFSGNIYDLNYRSMSAHHEQNEVDEYKFDRGSEDFSDASNGSPPPDASSPSGSDGNPPVQGDSNDPMLKFINEMLMEEDDLTNKPCMFHDCSALLAAEKSFYDVLTEPKPGPSFFSCYQNAESPNDDSSQSCYSQSSVCSSSDVNPSVESNWVGNQMGLESAVIQPSHVDLVPQSILLSNQQLLSSTNDFLDAAHRLDESWMSLLRMSDSSSQRPLDLKAWGSKGEVYGLLPQGDSFSNSTFESQNNTSNAAAVVEKSVRYHSSNGPSSKKNHGRDDSDDAEEHRSNKQLASSADESVPLERYDNVLLCPNLNPHLQPEPVFSSSEKALKDEARNKLQQTERSKASTRGRPRGGKKQGTKREVVDLRALLVQCAQAVANFDIRTSNELLARIRQHSSAHGDGMERLAHYFAIALEARLAGTGTTLYTDYRKRRISAADILNGYQMFVSAIPFKKVSNIFANKNIGKLAAGATRLHIIDFGILYGFQWPCLIQRLSVRPEGPPALCITGIDLPQPGLRPAERVEETGLRLARYCERFGVPFEFRPIAKKWDTIKLEDLKINGDEVLVVNCVERLANVPDETVVENSPRDAVLNLIKRIRPNMFIQSVINGTYNSPFFVTRFREALFHFSSVFDMFEATVLRENQDRALFEREIYARDALNVIACEGTERVERPETYKQWQVRNLRAGFRQLPLDQEIVKIIRGKVKSHYHRDFSVDEDGKWMLQGWKGRVSQAISCWEPVDEQ